MKVWFVFSCVPEDVGYTLVGAYTSRKKAEKAVSIRVKRDKVESIKYRRYAMEAHEMDRPILMEESS